MRSIRRQHCCIALIAAWDVIVTIIVVLCAAMLSDWIGAITAGGISLPRHACTKNSFGLVASAGHVVPANCFRKSRRSTLGFSVLAS